ncbi:HNH endonuclease [Pseudomonas asiatica]|uniref:HNH endonuclease n=1 Tax=Pseudomonas asiatica TaxID=2219225 RepID=UPI0035269288
MNRYKPKKRTVSLNSAAWKELRAQVLAEEPLCRWCLARGLYVPSTDVDHIKDSREDYSDDNRRENLTAMCRECHSLKTARDMGKRVHLGCDVNGMPIDPDHPWNREEKSPATADSKTAPSPLFLR